MTTNYCKPQVYRAHRAPVGLYSLGPGSSSIRNLSLRALRVTFHWADKLSCPRPLEGSLAVVFLWVTVPESPPNVPKANPSWFSPQVTKILNEPFLMHEKESFPVAPVLWLRFWSSYPSLKLEKPVSFIQIILCSLSLLCSTSSDPHSSRVNNGPRRLGLNVVGCVFHHFCCCWGLVGVFGQEWENVFLHFCLRGWIYFKTFNFRMVLDLQKSCEGSTQNSCSFFSQFLILLTFYVTMEHSSQLKGQH